MAKDMVQAAVAEDTAKAESVGLPSSTDQAAVGMSTSVDPAKQSPSAATPAHGDRPGIAEAAAVDITAAELSKEVQTPASTSAAATAHGDRPGIAEAAAVVVKPDEQAEEVQTPASTSAATQGAKQSVAAKSSSKAAWLGKASGLLGRWSVPMKVKKEPGSIDKHAKPVKVKKEPKSTGKHGVTDVIDLT